MLCTRAVKKPNLTREKNKSHINNLKKTMGVAYTTILDHTDETKI